VLQEVGAAEVPAVEVFNKCDLIVEAERRRLQQQDPSRLCITALSGAGREELLETIASRVALDTRRVIFEFDGDAAEDRERIALLYRHARVLSHTASNGRVAVEVDVPRRLLDRFVGWEEHA